jgi:hypothetical protein
MIRIVLHACLRMLHILHTVLLYRSKSPIDQKCFFVNPSSFGMMSISRRVVRSENPEAEGQIQSHDGTNV